MVSLAVVISHLYSSGIIIIILIPTEVIVLHVFVGICTFIEPLLQVLRES